MDVLGTGKGQVHSQANCLCLKLPASDRFGGESTFSTEKNGLYNSRWSAHHGNNNVAAVQSNLKE